MWAIEYETNVQTAALLLDERKHGRPKTEVVFVTHACELLHNLVSLLGSTLHAEFLFQEVLYRAVPYDKLHEWDFHHGLRQPLADKGKVRYADFLPFQYRIFTRDGIERGVYFRVSPFVLPYDFRYRVIISLSCTFSFLFAHFLLILQIMTRAEFGLR